MLSKYDKDFNRDNFTITLWIEYEIQSNITLSVEGSLNFTNRKELYYEFDIEDNYIYDRPDNSPDLLFLILIASLPWFVGSLFVLIYLRIRH